MNNVINFFYSGRSFHRNWLYQSVERCRNYNLLGHHRLFPVVRLSSISLTSETSCALTNVADTLLEELCENDQLDKAIDLLHCMHKAPSYDTYVAVLKACNKNRHLAHTKMVHYHLLWHRVRLSGLLGGYLVITLAKCGAIRDACQVSADLPQRTVFSWSAIIAAYADSNHGKEALIAYQNMLNDGVKPNHYTYVSLFKACAIIPDLERGKQLHTKAHREGIASNCFLGNALVSMYGKCGAIKEAEDVFCELQYRTIVSWTAMLSTYIDQGHAVKALLLYRQMLEEDVSPDQYTLVSALQACSMLAEMEEGKQMDKVISNAVTYEIGQTLHADVRRKGLECNVYVATALLKMYAKCGALKEAEYVFYTLPNRDTVSWNAMLTTYLEHNQETKVLCVHAQMKLENVCDDDRTVMCLLQAASKIGALEICQQLHFYIVHDGYDQIPCVATTLIHAYGSCGNMINAEDVFNKLSKPDVISFNACLTGHAAKGHFAMCLNMFDSMRQKQIKPDAVTFILLLLICNQTGLSAKALGFFDSMARDFGIFPELKHYSIVTNVLNHSGDIKNLETVLQNMPMQSDLTLWLSLLATCCSQGNLKFAKLAYDHAIRLQPKQATVYVLLSKLFSELGWNGLFAAETTSCINGQILV